MRAPRIAVFGSLVMDLVAWAPRRPRDGETLIGTRFERFLGGKGFNQAVAAARLGATVSMIGAVGTDEFAGAFVDALESDGIDSSHVVELDGSTGVGLPLVTEDGNVSIVGIAGVNDLIQASHAEAAATTLKDSDACVIQCEVPAEASRCAISLARESLTVLNAAPANDRALNLAGLADVLVVNEPELAELTGSPAIADGGCDITEIAGAAAGLLGVDRPSVVVATLASRGAVLATRNEAFAIGAHQVPTIDATGAGDALTAAIAVALSLDLPLSAALELGNAAGALAVQVAGALPSMPRLDEVESLLASSDAPAAKPV